MWKHVADFNQLKRGAENITINSVSITLKEKKGRKENNEKDDCQLNPYNKNVSNRSVDKNASKHKENTSKQTETHTNDTAISSYLKSPPQISILLGKYPYTQVVMYQSSHIISAGVENTFFLVIIELWGLKYSR